VCHYVSANGSTIVAYANSPAQAFSASYDLTNDAALLYQEPDQNFAFGALTPDGTLLMTMADVQPGRAATTESSAHAAANGTLRNGATPGRPPPAYPRPGRRPET
jgi:hypothetical protein